jgi:hypothetical protein
MSAGETNGIKRHLWSGIGAVLVFLAGQTVTAFYWAGQISARMYHVEVDVGRLDERLHEVEACVRRGAAD